MGQELPQSPNVIIIEADDLGYGDLSCYGAQQIQTPGMDRVAREGLRFTQGYCTAATSTPSRYSLLTGKYPWTNPDAKILPGNAPLIIDVNQVTIPKVMKKAGYTTGTVGKWHLGLGDGNVDWNQKVTPCPNEIGYDYSYVQAATNDRVPCIFIENGKGVGLQKEDPLYVNYRTNFEGEPTGKDNPELLRMHPSVGHAGAIVNGVPRIGFQKGGKSAQWRDEEMAELFLEKAKGFVRENKDKPFFLYYGLHQPHVPRVPNERFVGKSGMGPRGDVILEADWCVSEFLEELDKLGLTENTLVILTSDNGPVLDDGYKDQAEELVGNHLPSGPYKGGKCSMYTGGTCIPFLLRWPAVVKPGVSDAFVCQMDLLASLAALVGVPVAGKTDSQNTLPAFLGKSDRGREELVFEGYYNYAFRQGDWVMIPPYPRHNLEYQLYNVKEDVGQTHNLAQKHPDILKKMMMRFEELKRTTGKMTNF
ncbi:arylsulfatase [Parabacteroides goldsteinii]|uniref:sulfatase-like hydrolase/transferase n=1 Tax=Parabacteroides TaxID=375288 RepID=UPI001F2EE2D2|nr:MULTISPECIES: sulfatase-like hydrolase/transferase [Parabacteroides]GKG73543.1 arylsulfatase [Parabacteroides goldsteinii]GKG79478.1 arylsulfatase [Parabacteroides goldsteinii]